MPHLEGEEDKQIYLSLSFKGKYHGVLVSFVKNDEIRPSISCQIILE